MYHSTKTHSQESAHARAETQALPDLRATPTYKPDISKHEGSSQKQSTNMLHAKCNIFNFKSASQVCFVKTMQDIISQINSHRYLSVHQLEFMAGPKVCWAHVVPRLLRHREAEHGPRALVQARDKSLHFYTKLIEASRRQVHSCFVTFHRHKDLAK